MYIINTTFVTDLSKFELIREWLRKSYIPTALASGIFNGERVARVLSDDDVETVNIACEFSCPSLSRGIKWHEEVFPELLAELHRATEQQLLYFTTFLKTVD